MNKHHDFLIANGYVYDEEDNSYEKQIFSSTVKGMFVPYVRLFSIGVFDDYETVIDYNKSLKTSVETRTKAQIERKILEQIELGWIE